jgi:hypothetical protein
MQPIDEAQSGKQKANFLLRSSISLPVKLVCIVFKPENQSLEGYTFNFKLSAFSFKPVLNEYNHETGTLSTSPLSRNCFRSGVGIWKLQD